MSVSSCPRCHQPLPARNGVQASPLIRCPACGTVVAGPDPGAGAPVTQPPSGQTRVSAAGAGAGEGGVTQLLARWEEAYRRGQELSPAQLCPGRPDLAEELDRAIAALRFLNSLLGRGPADQSDGPRHGGGEGLRQALPPDAATPPAPSDSTPEGLPNIPGYQVLGRLGRGGMGVVYKARQRSSDRVVAVKMILPGQAGGAGAVQRLRAETQAVIALDHPHIVPVYDVGEYEGRPFFTMRLMEGGSLAERLPRLKDDPRAAVALLATVARAVHHAHQRGLIHRDLKPGNILLDAEGRPYVSDFGLVKRTDGDPSMTESGAIVGTPGYMAPEQASGRRDAVTTLVDVYGLGGILYEMMTGRPAFGGETPVETVLQLMERDPVPPQTLNPKADLDLATVCLKCLAKNPAERYPSAEALAEELERWLDGEPVRARPPSLLSLARSLVRRHARAAAWVCVVGLAAGLISGLHTYFTDIEDPLGWSAGAYAKLPSAPPPWLAALPRTPVWVRSVLGLAMLASLATMGLLAVLGVGPRQASGDVIVGLAAGTIAGVTALNCGVGWALIYGTSIANVLETPESRSLVEIGLKASPEGSAAPGQVLPGERGRSSVKGLPPGWQLEKYPELRGLSPEAQAELLHRKLRAELIVGVQLGIWFSLLAVGSFIFLATAEAVVAGSQVRRHGRGWAMLAAYADRAGPCVAACYAALVLAVNLLTARDTFRPWTWGTVLALAVAASFRWPWLVRVCLHVAWLTAAIAIISGVWLPHDP
jgi:hypothetical protein